MMLRYFGASHHGGGFEFRVIVKLSNPIDFKSFQKSRLNSFNYNRFQEEEYFSS